MFHFLSKILQFLTIPYVLILGVILTSFVIKNEKRKKSLLKFGIILLLFFSNDFIANQAMRTWEIPPVLYTSLKKNYKVGIILTGFTGVDKNYADRVFLRLDRVTHGVQLYKAGVIEKFLISGGQGGLTKKRLLEADQAEQVLLIMGVEQKDIMKESNSRNTHESAMAVATLLKGTDPTNCLLITSANHMRRASACFKKAGFNAQPFSTDLLSNTTEIDVTDFIIPSTGALWKWQIIFKEVIGCITYKLMGYI